MKNTNDYQQQPITDRTIMMKKTLQLFFGLALMIPVVSKLTTVNAQVHSESENSGLTYFQEREILLSSNPAISIDLKGVYLEEALVKIAKKAKAGIYFDSELIPEAFIHYNFQDTPLSEILEKVLEETELEINTSGRNIFLKKQELDRSYGETEIPNIEQYQETVTGRIIDSATGEALPGVNVIIEGTSAGTTTDVNGDFELSVPSLDVTLIVSYIGYQRLEVPIDGRTELNIFLESEIIAGDELVVVGYGAMERRDITGSVASINRREITGVGSYSMDNVLQGRVAGVNVSAGGFRPGETSSIQIRGARSLTASNAPLVVLDGIPIEGGLMELNPSDVESVEILKDASATAIYGSRGANGVILITSRQGREGIQVQYQGHIGAQWLDNQLDLMNTEQYAQFARDAYIAREVVERGVPLEEVTPPPDSQIFDGWAYNAIQEGRSINWQDQVAGRGHQQTHQLSILGGTETTRYNISGTFDEHFSPVRNNDYQRLSGRINLDQQISSRVQIGFNTHISNSMRHVGVAYTNVLRNSPMTNPFDENGNPLMRDEQGDRNPYFDTYRVNHLDERERTRIIASAYAEIDLIPERLSYRGMFSPDFRFRNDGRYRRDEPFSDARVNERRETSLLYENLLNFQEEFFGIHRVNITAMHSYQEYDARQTIADVTGLPYEHQLYHNIGSATQIDNISSSLSEWKLVSYMVRSNYVYDNRYLLTLTGRVDGSSRLADGNEYGFFPSGAIAWNIHNERFMRERDLFSELKLRFSIGDVGNTAIGAYATLGQLDWVNNGYAFSDVTRGFYQHGDIPNPDLTWERSRTMDVGLDWAIFDFRLQGSIDVYQTNTYDLLMPRQLPFTSGYTSTLENVGETQNRGVEFSLSSVNVHTQNFMWETDFNIAWNRNKIVSLYGGKEDDPGSGWFIGEPISVIWYWDWDGIWQLGEEEEAAVYGAQPGDVRFVDQNNDGVINDEDRIIRGDPFPNWIGGITNRINFRNLDMSVFVYASLGSMHYSPTHSSSFNDLLSLQLVAAQTNQMNVDYWMPDNPSNEYERPRFTSQTRTNIQAYWDSSFIRVKNIQLGYSLSPEFLSVIGLQQARIYAMVENPYTWTRFPGLDPEGARSYDHPNFTTIYGGLQLTF
jgi:TonB-linked SusC/RagA family outer membrane protein